MAVTLGSNIASIKGQRRLSETEARLRSTYERLSSGQRINRASDDAAGLAISSRLHADTRVYSRAALNASDAISLLNIADSAVASLSTIVTRIKELATQSANGVFSSKQREALNSEANALVEEYNRILSTTSFNGLNLIESKLSLNVQLGYDTLEISVGDGLSTRAAGTGTFTLQETIPGAFSNFTTLVDLDNDGDLDILDVSSGGGNPMYASLNNGDGTFASRITTMVGACNQIATGDVNNDGYADAIVTTSAANVLLLIGNGDGTFQAPQSIAVGATTRFAQLADMDRDGNLDLVSVSVGEQLVYIRNGNGDGSFDAASTYSVGNREEIAIVDVNEDGWLDVFTGANGSGGTSMALNNGSGGLLASTVLDAISVGGPRDLTYGDFDGDGNIDLIFGGDDASDYAVVRFGNGNGTFQTAQAYVASSSYISVADFNNDGLDDFMAGGTVFLSNGDRTFESSLQISADLYEPRVSGDLNGDGAADVVVSNGAAGGGPVVYFNNTTLTGGLASANLLTAESSRAALDDLDETELSINAERSRIGANMSRIAAALRLMQSSQMQLEAARSRIMDIDYAQEAADLARLMALQQVEAAVLSQANLEPQLALKLLA